MIMNLKIILALSISLYIASCQNQSTANKQNTDTAAAATPATPVNDGPAFKKEGILAFISKEKGDTISTVDIEIAETDEERAKGLMDRKTMTDTQGMLFIFPAPEEQSFWMKNTYISLDIMYVDENYEIVSIQKYAAPLSEESLPSFKKAQYVVEVIAGYTDLKKIKYGDKIAFKKD